MEGGLAFFYPKQKVYLSITGRAFVSGTHRKQKALEHGAAGLVAWRARRS
jgi:hypothetical protein